jgi:hypothetical protein
MNRTKVAKRVLLVIEITLFVASFIIGHLGNTDFVKSLITPTTYSAERSFQLLLQGRPVFTGTKGFPVFEKALNIYAEQHNWQFPSGRVDKGYLRPKEIQNRQSMINSTAVLNVYLVNGGFVHVSIPEYQAVIGTLVTHSTLPLAVLMFVIALCLLMAQHYFDVEKPNNRLQPTPLCGAAEP